MEKITPITDRLKEIARIATILKDIGTTTENAYLANQNSKILEEIEKITSQLKLSK